MFLMLKAYDLSNKISQTKPLKNFVEKKVGPHQFISSEDEKIDFAYPTQTLHIAKE